MYIPHRFQSTDMVTCRGTLGKRQTAQTLILKLTKKSGMRDVMLSKSL